MGCRIFYIYDSCSNVISIDDIFYWENIQSIKNRSIWQTYLDMSDRLNLSKTEIDSIKLMLDRWDNITDIEVF